MTVAEIVGSVLIPIMSFILANVWRELKKSSASSHEALIRLQENQKKFDEIEKSLERMESWASVFSSLDKNVAVMSQQMTSHRDFVTNLDLEVRTLRDRLHKMDHTITKLQYASLKSKDEL
jgi:chromosome segregation ATPase